MSIFPITRILEETYSTINGEIVVVKSLGYGVYIQVQGLTQSGGVVHEVWKTVLTKAKKKKPEIKNCLILGLGGGSAAGIVSHLWPTAKITGVDIDPVMVELGRRYLGIPEMRIEIADAFYFVEKNAKKHYDLILIDTYLFDKFPKDLESDEFLMRVKKMMGKKGLAIFNRLYWDEKRPGTVKFGEKLNTVFRKVARVFPEANLMFICEN